jgi:alkanesulfonate monooxygenase SsuD/methylene tetrahydromethanopterin reductase-like flavin-dependent oxidoreductase (luciferase family)
LVARFAQEWNAVVRPADQIKALNAQLNGLLQARGRAPAEVRRSLMAGVHFGRDQAELRRVLGGRDAAQLRASGQIIGTAAECADQLAGLAEAGVQRVMLQWLDLDDVDRLEAMGQALVPLFPA